MVLRRAGRGCEWGGVEEGRGAGGDSESAEREAVMPQESLKALYAERAALAYTAEHGPNTLVRERALKAWEALRADLLAKEREWAAAWTMPAREKGA